MAHSRLEKIGTIYSRTRGLIESGALNYNDRSLWFDVYEAFPPKEEPRFDRPKPNLAIREIFYKEDTVRALLHKNVKRLGIVNLLNRTSPSFTQKFVSSYQKLEHQYGDNPCDPEQLFRETLDSLRRDRQVQESDPDNNTSSDDTLLASTFKAAQMENQVEKHDGEKFKIKLKDLFKD